MRVGLLITYVGNTAQTGFYNLQEVGLAKALDKLVDEVILYKLVCSENENMIENLDGCRNAKIHYIPTRSLGSNGWLDIKLLDTSLDALVYFSDMQFSVPKVYRWAQKNGVRFFPYIGVVESNSTNRLIQCMVNFLFRRNLAVYRKSLCLAKTPTVRRQLADLGVKDVIITPVGLDLSLVKADCESYSPNDLKGKYGYDDTDKVLLFIGRLVNEKKPIKMIEILSELKKYDCNYKLIMVGSGELKDEVESKIHALGLDDDVQRIDRLPNDQIWELYRFADAFVNLNDHEIFGMVILEAMYYGCKVVAWSAPGPSFIIEDMVSGYLAESNEEIVEIVLNGETFAEEARQRVRGNFTWDNMANIVKNMLSSGGQNG